MIKTLKAIEKTNSYTPTPWAWSEDPFPAFRGAGQRYNAFLAVANGFRPWFSSFDLADNTAMSDDYCKVIKTKKGTTLLVPCSKDQDERIVLITALGGFRGFFGNVEAVGAEILWRNGSTMHCCPVEHIVARITDPDGYIWTETGRRSGYGDVEVYSWRGGYFRMDTREYKAAVDTGSLFASRDTIDADLERCKRLRTEQAQSRKARKALLPRFEGINRRLEACGCSRLYQLGDTFLERVDRYGVTYRKLYTEEALASAEEVAKDVEADYAETLARKEWQPQFKAAAEGYTFCDALDPWRELRVRHYKNVVSVWNAAEDKSVRYEYSADGLARFKADLPKLEAAYLEEQRQKAEAEAKAKAEAEEKARKAEAEAKAKAEAEAKKAAAEAEAKKLGLPGNIRLWHRSGKTNAGEAWVITPKGMDRECDYVDTSVCGSSSKRYHQSYEGDHVWNQILPGELVIYWSHAYTAAPHEFQVIYKPETLTEAQLERVKEIQDDIEERFFGKAGLTGDRTCPSVGKGWGLLPS